MSFDVFFALSTGLRKPIRVPHGTLQAIRAQVAHVEKALSIPTTKYGDNPEHWADQSRWGAVTDAVLCDEAERHNRFVRRLYADLETWQETPPLAGERLTPEVAAEFWRGLGLIVVPPERWTQAYCRARLEAVYEAMRGRSAEGMTFDARPLTAKQAASVINLFDQYLDHWDMRLDVPKGHDCLSSPEDDDGYEWCEHCGPIHPDEECRHLRAERRREDADAEVSP